MKAGDRIASINGTAVWTFADLQYRYDKVLGLQRTDPIHCGARGQTGGTDGRLARCAGGSPTSATSS